MAVDLGVSTGLDGPGGGGLRAGERRRLLLPARPVVYFVLGLALISPAPVDAPIPQAPVLRAHRSVVACGQGELALGFWLITQPPL